MDRKNGLHRQSGFTFPELLIAGAFVLVCIGVMLLLVRPINVDAERNNAKRRVDLAIIMTAIADYHKEQGHLPPSITSEEGLIATSEEKDRNLCDDLVPKYLDDMPSDFGVGFKIIEGEPCNALDQYYVSGYAVRVESGRVILLAPGAENKESITLERWFPYL